MRRYTDRNFTYKISAGPDIVRFLIVTCLFAPIRFASEISKKLVFLGYRNILFFFSMNVCVNFILFVADGLRQINGDTGRHLYGFTASILSLFVSIAGLAICYFTGAFGIRRVGENLVEKTEEELQRSVKTVSSEEIHETFEKDIGSLEKIEEKQEIKQTVAMSDDDKEDSSRDAIDVFDDKAQEMSYVEDLSARTENERDKNVKHEEKKFLTMEQRRQEFFEGMSAEEREKYNSALTSVIAPDFDTEDSKVDLYLQNLPTDKLTIDSFD